MTWYGNVSSQHPAGWVECSYKNPWEASLRRGKSPRSRAAREQAVPTGLLGFPRLSEDQGDPFACTLGILMLVLQGRWYCGHFTEAQRSKATCLPSHSS